MEEKIGSNAVLRPKIPMPLESKNPVTHDHDRQLMNVQTSEELDARRVMPRRHAAVDVREGHMVLSSNKVGEQFCELIKIASFC